MLRRRMAQAIGWVRRPLRRMREPHGLVLMYHRVAASLQDPWQLCVEPDRFESQIRRLRNCADLVPLVALRSSLRSGRRSRPVIAITFDDGYLDNLTAAKPILERFKVPATVFVSTGFIGCVKGYWWDRLAGLLLSTGATPSTLELSDGAWSFHWHDPGLSRNDVAGDRARRKLHDALWNRLSHATEPERTRALELLESWARPRDQASDDARPMNAGELRELVGGGLVDIGAHGVSHSPLHRLSGEDKLLEIERSRRDCAAITGALPQSFAFPHGAFDAECVSLVKAAGFSLACTSQPDLVWASGDAHATPRLVAGNESGEALWSRLRWRWLT